ncbi:helix-turn-helix transcriptional regulator [Aquimarina sp. 2201CG1-2-11]|uniref:helix-turn-helix domain-containing protein n=1 Tax=Aquimarina discodermiae TaxID=3231043 RepID=UPI003462C7C6
MVNSADFGKRIQKIMNHYAISAAAFADYMGVGRSSISHILSGRNKPSLDFVMKIVDAYKEVDLQWLLYGKGTFPRSENVQKTTHSIPTPTQEMPTVSDTAQLANEQDLFSNTPKFQQELTDTIDIQSIKENEDSKQVIKTNQEIDRIVIFYADGTFNSYEMKKS